MSEKMKAPDLQTDPKAQAFLEQFLKQECVIVLLHVPTRVSATTQKPLGEVRPWCEKAVDLFNANRVEKAPSSDFLVIEIRKSGIVRTTSLEEFKATPSS